MTTAVEGGIDTFVFPQEDEERAEAWKKMARIHPIFRRGVEMYDEVGAKVRS